MRNEGSIVVLPSLFDGDVDAGQAVAVLDDDPGHVTGDVRRESHVLEALVCIAVD
jgi:hypothetical protein